MPGSHLALHQPMWYLGRHFLKCIHPLTCCAELSPGCQPLPAPLARCPCAGHNLPNIPSSPGLIGSASERFCGTGQAHPPPGPQSPHLYNGRGHEVG